MNQGITSTPPGKAWKMCVPMWPWLAGGNWNIPNRTNQSSRLSSVWHSPNKQWLHAGVFFFVPSPLESVFNLIQLFVSLNVQIDCTVKHACLAGLDLRSGNTLTINKFEKWRFEIMSGLKSGNVTFNGTILKTNGCHSFLKPTYRCLDITNNISIMSNDQIQTMLVLKSLTQCITETRPLKNVAREKCGTH